MVYLLHTGLALHCLNQIFVSLHQAPLALFWCKLNATLDEKTHKWTIRYVKII